MSAGARARRVERAPGLRGSLLLLGMSAAAVFGLDTFEATLHPYLWFDVPVTRAVQAVDWGVAVWAFSWVDWLEGTRQVAVTAGGLLLVLLLNRRALPLLLVSALSGAAYSLTEVLVMRPRPPASLVHVVRHTDGFSYPSGHAVFFTWFVPLLVLALVRPRLPRAFELAGWLLAAVVLALACVGRVYDAEHWPSDVIGGVALGVAWTSVALSVRILSDPVLRTRHG